MKQLPWHITWLGFALLFMLFWFPPIGLLSMYLAFRSERQKSDGAIADSRRSIIKMRNLLRIGTFAGLLVFAALCAYVFIRGGELVPAIGSFY